LIYTLISVLLFRDAETLLKQILSRKLNDTSYTWLNDAERKYHQLVKDYRNALWDQSRAKISAANELTGVVSRRLQSLTSIIDQTEKFKSQLKGDLDKAGENVAGLKNLTLDIHDAYQVVFAFYKN
jgi:uncharacterized protein (DUF608 family)